MNLQSLILQVALYKIREIHFLLHCVYDQPLLDRNLCLRGSTMDLAASRVIKLPFRRDIGRKSTPSPIQNRF